MRALLRDLGLALRTLVRSPGYALVAILTLAVAIGANTAIFSAVDLVLLRPLPYERPDELVLGLETKPSFDRLPVPYLNYLDYRAGQTSFATLAAMGPDVLALEGDGGGEPERFLVEAYTHDYLPTLGVAPLLGRGFLPEEDAPGGARAVILGHALWSRRFAADPEIVGRQVSLDGEPWTVVGVMPADYRTPWPAAAYVPLGRRADEPSFRDRAARPEIYLYGRLKPGVTLAQARADLAAIGDELGRRFPEQVGAARPLLMPLHEDLVQDFSAILPLLLGAVGCVLLVAAANVANLTLERAMKRQRELGIRAALGASRWQLVRPMLVESAVVGLLGGALGLLFALWGVDLITAYRPGHGAFNILGPIEVDERALGFTAAVALGTGLLCGLIPALFASRQDLAQVLKNTDQHSSAGGRHLRARDLLVVVEVALAMMLTIGAVLASRSLVHLSRVDPGFDADDVVFSVLTLPRDRYKTAEQALQFWTEVEQRVAAIPGVETVTVSATVPGIGSLYGEFYPADVERTPEHARVALTLRADVGFVETLRISMLAGRACGPQDGPGTPTVVMVGRRLAEQFFPGQDPIGQRLQDSLSKRPSVTIVGVFADILNEGAGMPEPSPYQMIFCHRQLPAAAQADVNFGHAMFLLARTAGDPLALVPQMRGTIAAIDPENPGFGFGTVSSQLESRLGPRTFTARLLGLFAALAVLLAAVGLYAVIANSVARRTRELGVRMALGAPPRSVVALVVKQGMRVVAAGMALGLLGALALARTSTALAADGAGLADLPTYVGVIALLAATCLLATYVPARRATRIDPMIALRHD